MEKPIGFILFLTVLLVIGVLCLIVPGSIQQIAKKTVNWGLPSKIHALNSYMRLVSQYVQSDQYVIGLRIIGGLLLSVVAFLLLAFIKSYK